MSYSAALAALRIDPRAERASADWQMPSPPRTDGQCFSVRVVVPSIHTREDIGSRAPGRARGVAEAAHQVEKWLPRDIVVRRIDI